ncbi:hypothetical protein DFH06DRAFT_1334039 [Mycena polygramma]|nr:hypothetical protein DFH06DRAFT_1334039 [Mycena polygramma]
MSPDTKTQVSFKRDIDDANIRLYSRRMMTEMVIDSNDDQIATALAQWAEFDDETRPEALLILAHALVLHQQRLVIERHSEFTEACKKCRGNNSLLLYKRREDARRALDRSRQLPPGVPKDCPVILVDGVIEVSPFEDDDRENNDPTPRSPRSLSAIEQDDRENGSPTSRSPLSLSAIQQDESDGDSSDADSSSAVQSHEDAANAADALDAISDLPSPVLLPSPDLPSPTYNAHAHTAQCRYGPAGLEGQTDGENVEEIWRPSDAQDWGANFRPDFREGSTACGRSLSPLLRPPSPTTTKPRRKSGTISGGSLVAPTEVASLVVAAQVATCRPRARSQAAI